MKERNSFVFYKYGIQCEYHFVVLVAVNSFEVVHNIFNILVILKSKKFESKPHRTFLIANLIQISVQTDCNGNTKY